MFYFELPNVCMVAHQWKGVASLRHISRKNSICSGTKLEQFSFKNVFLPPANEVAGRCLSEGVFTSVCHSLQDWDSHVTITMTLDLTVQLLLPDIGPPRHGTSLPAPVCPPPQTWDLTVQGHLSSPLPFPLLVTSGSHH